MSDLNIEDIVSFVPLQVAIGFCGAIGTAIAYLMINKLKNAKYTLSPNGLIRGKTAFEKAMGDLEKLTLPDDPVSVVEDSNAMAVQETECATNSRQAPYCAAPLLGAMMTVVGAAYPVRQTREKNYVAAPEEIKLVADAPTEPIPIITVPIITVNSDLPKTVPVQSPIEPRVESKLLLEFETPREFSNPPRVMEQIIFKESSKFNQFNEEYLLSSKKNKEYSVEVILNKSFFKNDDNLFFKNEIIVLK